MKMLFSLIVTLAGAYLALVLLVFFLQSYLIYFPQTGRDIASTPEQIGLAYESVEIKTGDKETLHGWFVPAPDAVGTVLLFHGNAGNISHRLDYLPMFRALRLNTLMFDYRGYGRSSGTPTEKGTYEDAIAAWQFLTESKGIASQEIVLYGESLGGAVAAWLAVQQNPAMLVLASVFTSVPDLAETIYPFLPVRTIARFDYNTLKYLESINCPVLVAHSPHDEIVPFSHGRHLFHAAAEPKQFLTLAGGHNNGFIFMREEWINALGSFITAHLKSP
ncbi:alpha/beta hydrolase [Nitrosomonas sp.]|uniref:alpha/beta hydrolase n=1 Tax=Nitrosomonas sp. TaxID=42353 RepID=UPI0025FFD19D|nr:alpha/beta hydrolase [Nitrosomonas sp.]